MGLYSENDDITEDNEINTEGTPGYKLPQPEKEFEVESHQVTKGEMNESKDDESYDVSNRVRIF